jgi:hypothetical protein
MLAQGWVQLNQGKATTVNPNSNLNPNHIPKVHAGSLWGHHHVLFSYVPHHTFCFNDGVTQH